MITMNETDFGRNTLGGRHWSNVWTRVFGDAGNRVVQRAMKKEGQTGAAGFAVLWAEYPEVPLLAERMSNGSMYSSTQGQGDGTVQITFIFIGQTHLVFGKCVCTCVTKHSNAFRTFLNWLKNSKRVWHEPKLHILRLPIFANFDL